MLDDRGWVRYIIHRVEDVTELVLARRQSPAPESDFPLAIDRIRREADAARLRESRLQAFYDSGLLGVIFWNKDGAITEANDRFLEMVGYDREDLLAGRLEGCRLIPPECCPADRASGRWIEAAGAGPTEKEFIRRDGSRISALVAGAVLDDLRMDGVAFVLDITDRKRGKQDLQATEEKYRNLFENMAEEVHLWQLVRGEGGDIRTWRLVDANPPTLETWGRADLEEIRGKTTDEIFGPGATEHYLPVVRKIFTEGAPHTFEDYFPHLDRYFRFTSVPLGEHFITTGADITVMKKVELALRESEERLRIAKAAAGLGIHDYDVRTGRIQWDERVRELWGVGPDEPITLDLFYAGLHPDDRAATEAALERALDPAGEGTYHATYRVISRADGRERWVEAIGQVSFDRGQPSRLVGTALDVTERKAAERALRRSEARWNAAIESFAAGAIIATEDEQVIYWNPAAREMHGFTRPDEGIEPLARTPFTFELWTPDGSHLLERDEWPMRRIKRGEPVRDLELRIHRPDQGWEKVFSYSGTLVDTAEGERLIFLTCQDLTELRRAEEAMARQAELLRRIFESIPILLVMWDPRLQRFTLNPYTEQVLGHTTAEANAGDLMALVYPDEAYRARVVEYMQSLAPGWREWTATTKTGERVPIEWTNFRLADDTSIGIGVDLRERKRAEEALQKAHDDLAAGMEERTKELRQKEVLLKEVHHRVKNNLQVISSLVNLQADGSPDQTVREVLQDVTYRVRSMALVHEKLYQSADLSRIDFAEYTRSLLGYLWRSHGAAAAGVRLTFDLESALLPVDVAVPCGLILNELAGNALKHAFPRRDEEREGDPPEVTVSLQPVADGRVSLRVRDNGVGLPEDFDWRATASLGLGLVQMLSRQLDGSAAVRDIRPGTEIEVVFPSGEFRDGAPTPRPPPMKGGGE